MKKLKNKFKSEIAKENIDFYFELLDKRFKPEFDSLYIKEIQKLSQGFNIRLKREEKLKFCRKCLVFFDVSTREIRLNSITRTKDYICKNCSEVRRIKY